MPERPDPAKVIPGPDPGACPLCGEWRKSGMIHNCGNNPVNDPAKVIAEEIVECAARAANLEAGRQRGLAFEDDWHTLTEQERGGWRLVARAALTAAGFPVGEPRDVNEIIEPPIPWGRVRELLLGDETVDKAAHSLFDGVAAIERSATYAALAAAVDHAEKEER